jgi:lipopolysaccharide transport system permease protein
MKTDTSHTVPPPSPSIVPQGNGLGVPSRNNYLSLLYVMAVTDFKIKYDNSILGYMWSLLKPLMMFGTLYLVFSVFVRWKMDNYNLYLLLGIILWGFFAEVTQNSMALLVAKSPILKKIYFPRWIIVVSSSLTSVFTLLLNLVVFSLFFSITDAPWSWNVLWLGLFVVELYIISLGAAMLLCAFYPKYRDCLHIWEVLVQLGFWATPIIYPISIVPKQYHHYIFLNPIARIIQGARQATMGGDGNFLAWENHVYILSAAALVLLFGIRSYSKRSPFFAEEL